MMYVPAVTSKEANGNGNDMRIIPMRSDSGEDNAPSTPGTQKRPVKVARQYRNANFLRD
ncbi:MAG: hypothetical protein HRF40_07265 [Nitrososphaera sp.]